MDSGEMCKFTKPNFQLVRPKNLPGNGAAPNPIFCELSSETIFTATNLNLNEFKASSPFLSDSRGWIGVSDPSPLSNVFRREKKTV